MDADLRGWFCSGIPRGGSNSTGEYPGEEAADRCPEKLLSSENNPFPLQFGVSEIEDEPDG